MDLRIVSKHRNVIYGFAILWIVIYHAAASNGIDFSFGRSQLVPLDSFIRRGNMGVDAFLLLSGICLFFSFVRNPEISSFMRKRLIRIVPATFIVYTIFWLVRDLIIGQNLLGFLSCMTLMRFWMTGDPAIWFVSLILLLYVIYPYLFTFFFGRDGTETRIGRFIVTLCLVYAFVILFRYANPELFKMVEIALARIPAFIVGAWMGKFVYASKRVGAGWIAVCVAALLIFFGFMALKDIDALPSFVTDGPYVRFFMLVGAISLCFCIALVCEAFDKHLDVKKRPLYRFLAWTGTFSLELYLTHMMLGSVMHMLPFYEKGDLPLYLIMAVVAFVLAWAVGKLVGKLSARLREKQNPAAVKTG